jgi:malate dehydrogenase (oxaloacetate-decarboxylating)
MIRTMLAHTDQPIVFPLSNPTSACEATPANVLQWSEGRALVATGSPFDPVTIGGKETIINQGNNAFVFPGLGFGSILASASEITDGMVLEASHALVDHVPAGQVFPSVSELTQVSVAVATRVLRKAFAEGVARTKKTTPEDAERYVRAKFWHPRYLPFVR